MLNVRQVVLAALAVLCVAGSARAQADGGSEAYVEQAATEPLDRADVADVVSELDFFDGAEGGTTAMTALLSGLLGNQPGHTAVVEQYGAGNAAHVTQHGTRNVAAVYHEGADNVTRASQDGHRNVVGVWLFGSGSDVSVDQVGDDNTYILGFRGDGLVLTGAESVLQMGDNNLAVQIGADQTMFGIQQYGDGNAIWIQHNPIVP